VPSPSGNVVAKIDDETPPSSRRSQTSPRPHQILKSGVVLERRYRIQEVLGVGGMSTVYKARDLRFTGVERLCAIKEMFNVGDDQRLRQIRLTNFQREAALLATLTHPAIPRIYDFFEISGTIYLVLELIPGNDLETMLTNRRQPFAEDLIVQWATSLCDVLEYLHEQKPEPIIFRDLKPSSIMLRQDQSLVLVDFGIARGFAPSQKGTMIGTEGYAPPEQYRGVADSRGDIYALGATMHHLATASDPRSETPFTFAQRPPRRLNPLLSPEFEQVILRCVAYSAGDRFATAAELRDALRGSVNQTHRGPMGTEATHRTSVGGSALLAVPKGEERPWVTSESDRLDWSMTSGDEIRGSASQAGGAVYIGSYDQCLYAIDETDGSVRWRFRAQRGIVSRPLVVGDQVIAGSEDHNVYAVSRQNGRATWSFRTTMPVRSSAVGDIRGVLIGSDDGFMYRLDPIKGALAWRYRTWGPVRSTAVIVGATAVFGSDDGYVYCLELDSGQLKWRRQIGAAVMASVAVADGVLVVGASDGVIRGLDRDGGSLMWTMATGKAIVASPVIVDQTAYVGSADGSLYAVGLVTGELVWKQPLARQITATPAVDGEIVYVGGTDGELVAVGRNDGAAKWRYRVDGPIVSRPLVTADHIIFGSLDGKLYALHRSS